MADIENLLTQAKKRVEAMTDDEREEMLKQQRESWCIGEMMLSNPNLSREDASARCRAAVRNDPFPGIVPSESRTRTDKIRDLISAAEVAMHHGDFSNGVVSEWGQDEGQTIIPARLDEAIRDVKAIDLDKMQADLSAGAVYRQVQDLAEAREYVLGQYQPLLLGTAAIPAATLACFALFVGPILTLPASLVVGIAISVTAVSLIPFFAVSWQAKRSFRKHRKAVLNG